MSQAPPTPSMEDALRAESHTPRKRKAEIVIPGRERSE
jgi:hypothetical protein